MMAGTVLRRGGLILALVALTAGLGSCALAALVAGKGEQAALFKFEKNQRVLVLVDVRDGVTPPPAFASTLGDKIGANLFQNKAVNFLVAPDRLTALQQQDPARYKAMGIADIARAADADAVLQVYVTQLDIPLTAEHLVSTADAETFVKVVNRDGVRLYPGDIKGVRVAVTLDPELVSDRGKDATLKQITDLLAERTGQMFHRYALENVSHMQK